MFWFGENGFWNQAITLCPFFPELSFLSVPSTLSLVLDLTFYHLVINGKLQMDHGDNNFVVIFLNCRSNFNMAMATWSSFDKLLS